jgi:hypothetical protein
VFSLLSKVAIAVGISLSIAAISSIYITMLASQNPTITRGSSGGSQSNNEMQQSSQLQSAISSSEGGRLLGITRMLLLIPRLHLMVHLILAGYSLVHWAQLVCLLRERFLIAVQYIHGSQLSFRFLLLPSPLLLEGRHHHLHSRMKPAHNSRNNKKRKPKPLRAVIIRAASIKP